jgi:iron complex outermembrane receptor protein
LSFTRTASGSFVIQATPKNVQAASNDGAAETGARATENVIVTGTRLLGTTSQSAVETKTYTSEQIAASGQPSITRFFNSLPEVSQSSLTNPLSFGSVQTVQLRGFPIGSTLVLLDGKRVANSGISGTSFDLNNIPISLVERVDVLPIGSSAIYGSDAIAGVVNIILKQNVDGVSFDTNYGSGANYDAWTVTGAIGYRWDSGSVGLAASYETNSAVLGRDRAWFHDNNFTRFASQGGIDARSQSCAPGNVIAVSGNLPGLPGSFAAIPATITGKPNVSDFAATVGQQNLCNLNDGLSLVPAIDRFDALANGSWDITSSLHVFARMLYGNLENYATAGPISLTTQTVPAANAFNPFGVAVKVASAILPTDPKQSYTKTSFIDPMVGVRVDLPYSWDAEVTGQLSRDKDTIHASGNIPPPLLTAALASNNPATALNLFSVTNLGTPALLASVFVPTDAIYKGQSEIVEGVFRGPLFDLGSGPVEVALGASYEHQTFYNQAISFSAVTGLPTTAVTQGARDIKSVFGEMRAPILLRDDDGSPLLAATAAVRHDDYSDFGSATKPQIGLEFNPIPSLQFRASYAESFKAPQLVQLNKARSTLSLTFPDPLNGNALSTFAATFGGSPQLQPETGESKALGMTWQSEWIPGLTVNGTYWSMAENNRITSPSPAALLANADLFPGRVIRDASGHLVSVDLSSANFGALKANGIDGDVRYRFETSIGEFEPSVGFTLFGRFKAAVTPGSPLVDRLDVATQSDAWAPSFKGAFGLSWNSGPFSAGGVGHYVSRYLDYQVPANTNQLGDYWTFDLNARVDLGKLTGSDSWALRNSYISLSVANLLDRTPDYSNYSSRTFGYDPIQYDPLGRLVTLKAGVHL